MARNKILIPLNQSQLSQKILPRVEQLFAAAENDLVLYYITNPPGAAGFGEPDLSAGYLPLPGEEPVMPTLHPIFASQQEDSIRAHVEAELSPLIGRLRGAGYAVALEVGFDRDPVGAIVRAIGQHEIGLVAMSTRARVGVTRFFFRNIADAVAQQADVPVMLVHPRGDRS